MAGRVRCSGVDIGGGHKCLKQNGEEKHMRYQRFFQQITEFIFVEDKPEKADIIFIPGNGYPQMAERAAALYRDGFVPRILPSGRYSILTGTFSGVLDKKEIYRGDFSTEWEFLSAVLEKNGVPRESILTEDQATYTYENAIYSRKVTDSLGMEVKRAIICCRNFHARRSLLYYQLLYPDTRFIVCPAQIGGITGENWQKTPEGIEAVLGEVERCGSQFHQIARQYGNE